MAEEKKIIYRLDVDTSGTKTDQARASLEALKKKILETEAEITKLRKGVRDGSKTIEETAGPISQLETRLKGLRVGYQEVQRDSIGVQGFTEKIGAEFAKAVSPIEKLLGALGPMGGQLGVLVSTFGGVSSALDAFFSSSKKSSDGMDGVAKSAANAGAATAKAEKQVDGLSDAVEEVAKPASDGGKGLEVLAKSADQVADESKGAVTGIEAITNAADDLATSTKAGGAGLDELSRFTRGAEDSAKGASGGITSLIGGINPLVVGVGLAAGAIVAFGKELFEAAKHIEIIDRKARVLFGDSFPKMDAAAKANANAIGLTTTEYLALASSQKVVFDSLGFTTDQASEMTPKLLELADGLADFSGGQIDSAQAASILQKAVQGSTKGLSELGIPIKRMGGELKELSDGFFASGKYTKDQADAMASLQIVYDTVGQSVDIYNAKGATIEDRTDEINARFREQKDALAKALVPAFNAATEVLGSYTEALTDVVSAESNWQDRLTGILQLVTGVSGTVTKMGLERMFGDPTKSKQASDATVQGLKDVVNEQTAAAASTDELIAKREQLNASAAGFAKQGKTGVAEEIEGEIVIIDRVIAKREEEQKEAARLGLTYESLQATLQALQETRKTLNEGDKEAIDANTKEIAAVEKRLKVFDQQKKGLSELQQAQKQFAQSQAQLALQHELTTAKINDALADGLIDQQTAQKMALDLEVANIAARLQAKETLAMADKRITDAEKANILELNEDLNRARKAVEDYGKVIAENIKDREATIKVELEMAEAGFDQAIAEAISLDTLTISFDDAFTNISNNFGQDVRDQLLQAAKDGSVDFASLTANIDTSVGKKGIEEQKKLIAELQRAYERFRLETEKNKLTLIQKQDQAELDAAKTKLAELRKALAEITAKNDQKVALGVDVPAEDVAKVDQLQTDIDALEGKVVAVSVKVNTDTSALAAVDQQLGQVQPVTPETGTEGQSDSLLQSLGLDEESTAFAVEAAQELVDQINSVWEASQQARIQRTLERETNAAQANYDAHLNALNGALASGAITQAEFDARALEAQKQVDAAKLAAQRKAFEDKKRMDKAQAWINFGMELSSLAMSSAPLGIAGPVYYSVQSGLAGVRLAANLALIGGQKFEKGGVVMAQGGNVRHTLTRGTAFVNLRERQDPDEDELIARMLRTRTYNRGGALVGPAHAQGGIPAIVNGQTPISLEGGELVVNKRSAAIPAFREAISRMNAYRGYGVAFANGGIVSSTPVPSFTMPSFSHGGSVPRFELGGSLVPSENTIANQEQLRRAITPVESTSPIASRIEQDQRQYIIRTTDLDHLRYENEARLAKVTY